MRYNWLAIKKYTKSDINKILKYLYNVYMDTSNLRVYLRENEYARNIAREKLDTGMSFMFNLDDFLSNKLNATHAEMYVYLDLISKRDYFTYLNSKKKILYLPSWQVEYLYDINKLKMNRLLSIKEDKIYFVYEGDNSNGKEFW